MHLSCIRFYLCMKRKSSSIHIPPLLFGLEKSSPSKETEFPCRSSDLHVQTPMRQRASFAFPSAPLQLPSDLLSQKKDALQCLQHRNKPSPIQAGLAPCSGFSPDSLVQQNKNACFSFAKRSRASATKAGAIFSLLDYTIPYFPR